MNKHLTFVIVLAAGLALILAAAAPGSGNRKLQCVGNLCIADDGGISPKKLPRHGKAPVTAQLSGEISTRDGSHPPAVETLEIEIDKTIAVGAGTST